MTRFPISFEQNMPLKKGTWTPEEDRRLVSYIKNYGIWNWNEMPKYAGLLRSGKSCRLRWMNYLRPDIKHGNFTKEEEETIIRLHKVLGNRWAEIAQKMSQRTDNEIKNYWNTHLKKLVAEKEKIDSSITIDANALSLELEDYILSPESSVLNSPAAGSEIDSVFIKEENAGNVYGEIVQSLRGPPMSDEVVDEYLVMMMRAPSQQLWLYESTLLCDSYNADDFWSSASI